ncbi:MAG: lysine--tRNA ligase [Oscillospiraceae bacterium]|nr:lysine--tRNA ligase [Oscillospiraceae bacterium]
MENNGEAAASVGTELQARTEKLNAMRGTAVPYADRFERTHRLSEAAGLGEGESASICGRIVFKRDFGKFMFMKLQDIEGTFQISVAVNELGAEGYAAVKDTVDIADFVGATGTAYVTRTGERTLRVTELKFLSKSLRPLPEKFHGMQDADLRYRQRYLDLVSNPGARRVFLARSRALSLIRGFLGRNGFMEVETPILQDIASGAAARPFVTRHNAMGKDFFLRIAPELYLKQAIAGGFDRIFEIGKCFRNEGLDASHLQEFTMLEWYAAYWDYRDNLRLTRGLLSELVPAICGSSAIEVDGHLVDFGGDWAEMDYCERLSGLIGDDILLYGDCGELRRRIAMRGVIAEEDMAKAGSVPALIDALYKKAVRPGVIQPTVITNYPACLLPLARRGDKDPRTIDMFQLVACGWELVKAYSELVDPMTQREAFAEQAANKAMGDDESFEPDESFLLAMEHGMPPISGLGLGIDRLLALLLGQSTLRDVVLFPQTR